MRRADIGAKEITDKAGAALSEIHRRKVRGYTDLQVIQAAKAAALAHEHQRNPRAVLRRRIDYNGSMAKLLGRLAAESNDFLSYLDDCWSLDGVVMSATDPWKGLPGINVFVSCDVQSHTHPAMEHYEAGKATTDSNGRYSIILDQKKIAAYLAWLNAQLSPPAVTDIAAYPLAVSATSGGKTILLTTKLVPKPNTIDYLDFVWNV